MSCSETLYAARGEARRLEDLQRHYLQNDTGPRTLRLVDDGRRWCDILGRLDAAEAAANAEDATREAADALRPEVTEHAGSVPTR